MITIRLMRVGKKNDPSFRVIVVDSKRKPQPGNYLEMVGSYDPRQDRIELKAERIKHWMENGAKTSDTVHNLLVSQKIIDAKKINILPAFKIAPVAVAADATVAETSVADAAPLTLEDSAFDSAASPAPATTEDNSVAQEEATS